MVFLYAWTASIVFAINGVAGKFLSKYFISNPWFFNFTWNTFRILTLLPIFLFVPLEQVESMDNIFIAGLLMAISNLLMTFSMYNLDLSVLSPLFSIRSVFAIILSAILLNPIITSNELILAIIIVSAGLFVSYDDKLQFKAFFSKHVLIALLMMIIFALLGVYMNKAINENGLFSTILYVNLVAQFLTLPTIAKFHKEIKHVKYRSLLAMLGAVTLGTFGIVFENMAYSIDVPIATIIISLPISLFIILVLAKFKPNLLEVNSRKVYIIRTTSALIMVGSAILLNLLAEGYLKF